MKHFTPFEVFRKAEHFETCAMYCNWFTFKNNYDEFVLKKFNPLVSHYFSKFMYVDMTKLLLNKLEII